jgi:prepilin-type processing-associated H-X9-DG protein
MKRGCLIGGTVLVGVFVVWSIVGVVETSEAVRRAQCVGHLKWIILHLHNYHSAHGSFPAGTIPNRLLAPEHRLGWMVELWSVLAIGETLEVDRSKGWNEAPNWPPRVVAIDGTTFAGGTRKDAARWVVCPDDPAAGHSVGPFPLTYVGIAGLGADAPTLPAKHRRAGVFGFDRATRIEDITDGLDQTMMLIETTRDHRPWTAGGPSSVRGVDPEARPHIGRNRPFGGYHPGGANAAFADGSVRFLRSAISPDVFEAFSTIAGGEPVPAPWDE